MKHCIPDWNLEADFPLSSQRGLIGSDDDLVELLWQNGQVVMHSQSQRKHGATVPNESKQVTRHDEMSLKVTDSFWNSSNLIQDDDTVSWIQFPVEDSLEKDFCSNLFTELSDRVEAISPTKEIDDRRLDKAKSLNSISFVRSSQPPVSKHPRGKEKQDSSMPPPKFQMPQSVGQIPNSVEFVRSSNLFGYPERQFSEKMKHGDVKESSIMTVGSSHCSSNQITNEVSRASSNGFGSIGLSSELVKDTNGHGNIPLQNERMQADIIDPNLSSSSDGSGSSFMQSTETNSHKRKARNAEYSECQSDAVEVETAGASKQPKRSGSMRRSRAAEVHNLSERKRRDRINEKMKALQELIPNSNKSDKASMLDEAIEYMKSLQLQLQMMWMGSSMTPMMFPGIQHYMSRMGMGVCATLPSINTSMHLPRVPLVDQSLPLNAMPNQSSGISPLSFQNQLHNPNLPEHYAHYLGFHNIQAASQPANMFGVQALQHNQTMALPGTNTNAVASGAGKYDRQGGKQG